MADLILPARFASQPQYPALIDAVWYSKRPRVIWLPNALTPRDLVGPYNVTDTSTTSTIKHASGPMGRMQVWDFGAGSATSRILTPSGAINGSGGVTWLAVVRVTSFAGVPSIASSLSSGSGGLQWRITTGGLLEMTAPGVVVYATGTTALQLNTWHVVACSIAVTTPTSYAFAVDGKIGGTGTCSNAAVSNGVGAIGERYTGSSQPMAGQIALFAAFDKLFSQAELSEITARPWQLFNSPTRRLWPRDTASGTAITGTSTTTLDAVTTSATATLQLKAAAGITLDSITPAAASKLYLAANSSAQLADLATSATGAVQIKGASSITLGDLATAAAAALQIKAAAGITLGSITASGAGVLPLVGTGGGQLDSIGAAATGALQIKANASITLDSINAAGTGSAIDSNTGTSSITLDAVATSGAATLRITGAGSITLDSITPAAASKLYLASVSSVQLDGISTSGAATLRLVASGGITLGDVSTSGTGAESVIPAVLFGPRPGGAQTQTTLRSGNATRTRATASGGRRR